MKEATGELSMTTITIIAIIAIAGIVSWLAPAVKNYVQKSWGNLANNKVTYVEVIDGNVNM